jgi:hypothetical protein
MIINWTFPKSSLRLDWREAILFASYLEENSKWSKTIYTYQKAALMSMLDPRELTNSEQTTIENLMRNVPVYKQRIAGKSLPMEKFACKKSARFFAQQRQLIVPAIELMYVWNMFRILGKHFYLIDGIYKIIEKTLSGLEGRTEMAKYEADNRALLLLLQGACLRQMKSPLQAMK